MQLSAFFPTRTIGSDPAKIRDWAQAAEDLGYDHIEVPDHVFGATARANFNPVYTEKDAFHETFTTMAFLAGVTKKAVLASGVLILPQRQTGVVAKQTAEIDILSAGRMRLGIGVGWNHVEYESLNATWNTRGAMQAEQIEVLRRLWTEDLVTFKGKFHTLDNVNILPAPIQKSIPIWFGGSSDAVIKRCARLGDGWMPILSADETGEAKVAQIRAHLKEFGRDPAKFGLEAWVRAPKFDPDAWARDYAFWKRLGFDIAMLYPTYDLPSFDAQIDILRRFKDIAAAG